MEPAVVVEGMRLMIGKTLGHYRVGEQLGRGGMGEVYLADDLNLNRKVALKFLPDIFTGDPERMARFEREAKLLASLNHPSIAAIYGLEQADGKRFIAMELVEGETLAQRIDKGPLPIEEALAVCRQIAEALEAAHEKGVIHRDLKPANVMLAAGDKVKILDFGLAKALADETQSVDSSQSPTITEAMTRPGVILGTAAYMSPEQAKGKSVDKRADIWAFGCILYECLTGKRAFEGETVTETLAAILKGEPNWKLLPPAADVKVRHVLQRCLQKDVKLRYHDITDAWLEMEAPVAQASEPPVATRRFSLLWLAAYAAVMLLAGILIGPPLMKYFQPASPAPVVTATIKIEPGRTMQRPARTAMAFSSDGRFIVYSAIEENSGSQAKPQLYLRRMDQPEAKTIAGTEGGINPFLSPDNRWVGFWADGKLKKVTVEGGATTTLCDVSSIFGADWDRDNNIIFTDGAAAGLSIVSAEVGKPETLTKPDPKKEEYSHRLPSWIPNSKAVLFTGMRWQMDSQPWLGLLRMDTREWHVLLQNAANARYVSTGHIVFLRQGTLMAVRFDPAKLEVIGQPVALMENVMQSFGGNPDSNTGAGQFHISETGSLIYAAGGIAPDLKNLLVWVDQEGKEKAIPAKEFPFFCPRLSPPDGQRIAYSTYDREYNIWVYDLIKGTNSSLTSEGRAVYPIWTPDGKRLLFSWNRSLVNNLFWQHYDGSSPMERFTTSEFNQYPGSWSADGKTVAFVEARPDTAYDIAMLDVPSRRVTQFLNSQFNEQFPEFSPDGRWIAYSSNESKRDEVYVTPFPGADMKSQVSSEGGIQPLWAKNGKQLFYRWQDQVWVVDVKTDGGFATSKPHMLFEKSGYSSSGINRSYDLSLDGQRFLMVKREQRKPTPITELTLIQNWFEELKRLLPTEKK
jgi:Tol biopolymer transport system component/predicted Ser/Thr protein kinase